MRGLNPIRYVGEVATSGGLQIPPEASSTAAVAGIDTAVWGVTYDGGTKSWGVTLGLPNAVMTSPTAPAPYSVTGEQPSNEALPSTNKVEWDSAAWGVFGAPNRAYLTTYAQNWSMDGYGNNNRPEYRKEQINAAGDLREPRSIIYGVGATNKKRIGSYGIRSAFNGRGPIKWKFYGGNSAAGPWTQLDSRTFASDAASGINPSTLTIFSIPDQSLVPVEGFAFYKLEFLGSNPIPAGSTGYIDLAEIKLYTIGYSVRSTARIYPSSPSRAAIVVRIGGKPNLTPSDLNASVTRDPAQAVWAVFNFTKLATLSDGTSVWAGEAPLDGQPAGTSLVGQVNFFDNAVRLYGWHVGQPL